MERRILGRTGMDVSILGFGSAEIGYQKCRSHQVERLIGAALDAGINVIDTAECYPGSEGKIGSAVSHRRREYFLFTKCGHACDLTSPDWEPDLLEMQIERSLRLLRTDYIDLLSLHSCPSDVLRRGDVIEVLLRARRVGKVRHLGYSGDGPAAIESLRSGAFEVLQTSVNVADQQAVELTLPIARKLSIGVIAKRPIANVAWRTRSRPSNEYNQEYRKRLNDLQYDFLRQCPRYAVSTALRFTLAMAGVSTAIVGTVSVRHLIANVKAVESGYTYEDEIKSICARWNQVARPDWNGRV